MQHTIFSVNSKVGSLIAIIVNFECLAFLEYLNVTEILKPEYCIKLQSVFFWVFFSEFDFRFAKKTVLF